MSKPVIHEPPADHLPPGIEYFFPLAAGDLESKHRSLLTDWFTRFFGLAPRDIRDHLQADWAREDSPAFRKFTAYLLTLTPTSIVFCGDKVWVALKNPDREAEVIMIHEPRILSDEEAEFVSSFGIQDLEPFCRHFYDTYQYVHPYVSGLTMDTSPTSNEALGKLGNWEGGIYLYYISTGDAILLARSGAVGVWSHDVGWGYTLSSDPVAVEQIADSFDHFIDKYILTMNTPSLRNSFW